MQPHHGSRFRPGRLLPKVVLLAAAAAWAAAALEPGQFSFQWADGRCSLEARDARVADILADIRDATGIPIAFDEDDPATTTQSAHNVDLERLMRLLAENVVMTFVADPSAPDGYRLDSITIDRSADEETRARARAALTPPAPEENQASARRLPAAVVYSGVGGRITYSEDRQGIHFIPISREAPIAQAGITPKDTVTAIDGKPVASFESLAEMSGVIRGEEGSMVTFTVRRSNGAIGFVPVRRAQVVYRR
jgi:hypothetical protein